MKKIIIWFCLSIIIVGCGTKMGNTPTKKVEDFVNNYQTLDQSVLKNLDEVIEKENFTDEHKKTYRDIVKENYRKMTYVIKDEVIDGNNAVVTVEISVVDYSKINNEADLYLANNPTEFNDEEGVYDANKFIEYRLGELKKAKDMVTYTLELELEKIDDEWKLNELDEVELSKINGTYNY